MANSRSNSAIKGSNNVSAAYSAGKADTVFGTPIGRKGENFVSPQILKKESMLSPLDT